MSEPLLVVGEDQPLRTIARNVATRYLSIAAEMLIGLVTLPFNLHHLGADAYGLWMLTAGVTIHFSILDLGYGGAIVKFIAQYRAWRDTRALNEIASTMFFLFAAFGVAAYLVAAGLAFNLEHVFRINQAQAETGKWILLIIGINVAMNFPFSVFGGVTSGFQRYDINNLVAIVSNLLVGAVNIAVVLMGYGLIPLVAATSFVRFATYFVYRRNAFTVYPALQIRLSLFRRARLKEVTGFSVYSSVIDWANKLNYELDEIVIGIFMGAAPVAAWAVADRIVSGAQRLTNQVNAVLFPVVVDADATQQIGRLQQVLIEGTRLSLATVLPIAVVLLVLAYPLVDAWVGARMIVAAPVIQILAVAVALRVGNATSTTLLKGAGQVRRVAMVNIVTGLVNLALSAALVTAYGLVGVAVGTLVPVAIASIFVLFPDACRRVELPVAEAFSRAVWPAVWPAVVTGAVLMLARPYLGSGLIAVLIGSAVGASLYVAFFVLAVGRRDRAQQHGTPLGAGRAQARPGAGHMRGVILAAGKGSRLNGTAGDKPKCLVQAGGRTLLDRQIAALHRAGIDDIVAVVGCQAERVRAACGPAISYVENARFAETNSLFSLWTARALLLDGFVVLNCDVLFHPAMLEMLLATHHEAALLIALREAGQAPFGDEEMKVRVDGDRVIDMSKTMAPARADGENVGIVKFGPSAARQLVGIMDRLIADGGTRDWAPTGVSRIRTGAPAARRPDGRLPLDRNRLSRRLPARRTRRATEDRHARGVGCCLRLCRRPHRNRIRSRAARRVWSRSAEGRGCRTYCADCVRAFSRTESQPTRRAIVSSRSSRRRTTAAARDGCGWRST